MFLKAIRLKEMCNKAVNTCFFLFDYVPDRCKTQKICDDAIDDCLAALKFVPD